MGLGKEVVRNSIFNNTAVFIRSIGGIIFTIIVARLLHPEFFGLYFLSISIASIFVVFTDLGLSATIIRWIAHAIGKNDKVLARSYYRYLFRISMILSLITSFAVFVSAEFLSIVVLRQKETCLS